MKVLNRNVYRQFLTIILLLSSTIGYTQEICDNGIDDDGDGLIDIQDGGDCICGEVLFQEIYGDFEDFSCCPETFTSFF